MKHWMLAVTLLIAAALLAACVSQERRGQRLFAGCLDKVDDSATLKAGVFVCEGDRDPEPFGGNGRTCGDCHVPGDNFGISIERIAMLPDDHPFFFPGLDEKQIVLRGLGLVHVIVPGKIDEFRQTPKLVHLQRTFVIRRETVIRWGYSVTESRTSARSRVRLSRTIWPRPSTECRERISGRRPRKSVRSWWLTCCPTWSPMQTKETDNTLSLPRKRSNLILLS